MIFKKSPFQFAMKNSFLHKKQQVSENKEDIDDYAAQDLEIMNTMEATKHFCFHPVTWSNFILILFCHCKL